MVKTKHSGRNLLASAALLLAIILLENMGWRVIVVWECEIRKKERRKERLDEIYLEIVSGKTE